MNLGFDAKRAFHNATGLGNYSRDVLRVLLRHRPGHRYVAYSPRPGTLAFDRAGEIEVRGPERTVSRMLPALWRQAGVVGDLRRDGIELYHGLSNELPAGIERAGIRSVVTIHDLIFERFPELYPAVDRRIYRHKFRSAAERADLVVAISHQTARDLQERYRISRSRIRVVYQGCHGIFQEPLPPAALAAAARKHALPPSFVLAVGTVERRKNLLLAVKAVERLEGVHLVSVGRPTAYQREVEAHVRARGLDGRVHLLSGVPLEELAALYRLATVFVYPSVFEGFGIPILEALFSGTPVVTTRGGCFGEAGGPGSAYVDPADPEELRGVLAALLADEGRRSEMRARGLEHAQRFRDEVVAGELFRVYEEILGAAR